MWIQSTFYLTSNRKSKSLQNRLNTLYLYTDKIYENKKSFLFVLIFLNNCQFDFHSVIASKDSFHMSALVKSICQKRLSSALFLKLKKRKKRKNCIKIGRFSWFMESGDAFIVLSTCQILTYWIQLHTEAKCFVCV